MMNIIQAKKAEVFINNIPGGFFCLLCGELLVELGE
jgi:hypothetical protein